MSTRHHHENHRCWFTWVRAVNIHCDVVDSQTAFGRFWKHSLFSQKCQIKLSFRSLMRNIHLSCKNTKKCFKKRFFVQRSKCRYLQTVLCILSKALSLSQLWSEQPCAVCKVLARTSCTTSSSNLNILWIYHHGCKGTIVIHPAFMINCRGKVCRVSDSLSWLILFSFFSSAANHA